MTNRTRVSSLFVLLVMLASIMPASAGARTVTLDLKQGRRETTITACGRDHQATIYDVGDRVRYGGRVAPAPSGDYNVRIIVRRCMNGKWVTVMTMNRPGRADGTFYGSFPVGEPSRCYVRAIYSDTRSTKDYFRVRP